MRRLAVSGMRQVAGEEVAAANLGNDEADGKREVTSEHCPGQVVMVYLVGTKYIRLMGLRGLFSGLRCLDEVHLRWCSHRLRKVETFSLERRAADLTGKKLLVHQLCVSGHPRRLDN